MAQILVRNLDEAVVAKLKERAKENDRSLQAEAKLILEQATGDADKVDKETARRMFEELQRRFAGRKFLNTVELIREDRDR